MYSYQLTCDWKKINFIHNVAKFILYFVLQIKKRERKWRFGVLIWQFILLNLFCFQFSIWSRCYISKLEITFLWGHKATNVDTPNLSTVVKLCFFSLFWMEYFRFHFCPRRSIFLEQIYFLIMHLYVLYMHISRKNKYSFLILSLPVTKQ